YSSCTFFSCIPCTFRAFQTPRSLRFDTGLLDDTLPLCRLRIDQRCERVRREFLHVVEVVIEALLVRGIIEQGGEVGIERVDQILRRAAGANRPYHVSTSQAGNPNSSALGTSGR